MKQLNEFFSEVDGGVRAIATACGVTVRAVYKWAERDCMPRTEYTGETEHAKKIVALPGATFTAQDLLRPIGCQKKAVNG